MMWACTLPGHGDGGLCVFWKSEWTIQKVNISSKTFLRTVELSESVENLSEKVSALSENFFWEMFWILLEKISNVKNVRIHFGQFFEEVKAKQVFEHVWMCQQNVKLWQNWTLTVVETGVGKWCVCECVLGMRWISPAKALQADGRTWNLNRNWDQITMKKWTWTRY